MKDDALKIMENLIKAAEAGECPDPSCTICLGKRRAIKEAKDWVANKALKLEEEALELDQKLATLYRDSYSHVILQDENWDKERFEQLERFLLTSFAEIAEQLQVVRGLLEPVWVAGMDWKSDRES